MSNYESEFKASRSMVIRAALRLRVAQCIMALFSSPSLAIAVIVFSVSLIVYSVQKKQIWRARSLGRPLPPGPRPLPIVGNFIHPTKFAGIWSRARLWWETRQETAEALLAHRGPPPPAIPFAVHLGADHSETDV